MNIKHYTLILLATTLLVGCNEENNIPAPGNNTQNYVSPGLDTLIVDNDSALNVPANAITVKEALAIGRQLQNGTYTGDYDYKNNNPYTTSKFYIKGIVQSVKEFKLYNNKWEATFYLADTPYAIDKFYCYQVYTNYPKDKEGVARGNVVVVECQIMCYGTTIETYTSGSVYSTTWTAPVITTKGDGSYQNPYTVADIRLLDGSKTTNAYVRGYIVGSVTDESKSLTNNIELSSTTTKASNILLADTVSETMPDNLIPIKLPTGDIRNALKLGSKCPEHYGKQVLIYGTLGTWISTPTITDISYAEIDTTSVGTKPKL